MIEHVGGAPVGSGALILRVMLAGHLKSNNSISFTLKVCLNVGALFRAHDVDTDIFVINDGAESAADRAVKPQVGDGQNVGDLIEAALIVLQSV